MYCKQRLDLYCILCRIAHVLQIETRSVLHSESERTCIVDRNQFCTVLYVRVYLYCKERLDLYCILCRIAQVMQIETSSVLHSESERTCIVDRDQIFTVLCVRAHEYFTYRDLFCIVPCKANSCCCEICIVVIACRFRAVVKLLSIRGRLYCGQNQILYSSGDDLPRVREHM